MISAVRPAGFDLGEERHLSIQILTKYEEVRLPT